MRDLYEHLKSGITTVCRAWLITRRDGITLGFTDHDRALRFDGAHFEPDSGFSGLSVFQETGLSIDNTEALGVLRDDRISEADLRAGRYDGAEVTAYLVNWANPDEHIIEFRGSIGEITIKGKQFQAEVRGQIEALNRNMGQVFQSPCSARLGDTKCKFDLTKPGYQFKLQVESVRDRHTIIIQGLDGIEAGWFARGMIRFETGRAEGLSFAIKSDVIDGTERVITLWDEMTLLPEARDDITVIAGCDKQFRSCRLKFQNVKNFLGFPDIPSHDWVLVHPNQSNQKSGGSRR